VQGLETLRRSKGMDAVIMVAEEGTAYAMWRPGQQTVDGSDRFPGWLANWKAKSAASGATANLH
jgi:carbamoyltransferase